MIHFKMDKALWLHHISHYIIYLEIARLVLNLHLQFSINQVIHRFKIMESYVTLSSDTYSINF